MRRTAGDHKGPAGHSSPPSPPRECGFTRKDEERGKQTVAESSQVCYTHLARGGSLQKQASLRLRRSPCGKDRKKIMKQKLKTHTAMAKRIKITGSGRVMRRKVALSHLRRNKSPHAVRSMDKMYPLATGDRRRMKRLLPYSL